MNLLSLTESEQDALAGVTADLRDRAFALDRAFRRVMKPVQTALKSLAADFAMEYGGIKTIYYAWKKQGVIACVDKRHDSRLWGGRAAPLLPPEVLDFWKGLQLEFSRDTTLKACHRRFIQLWRMGKVPGLPPDCEVHPRTLLPHGCSHGNLRHHRLTPYQKKAVQIGRHSASALLPKVLTTRIGLQCGEVVEFDDQEHDVQVGFVGVNSKITRPKGFHSLDFASGCDTLQSFKPTVLNPDGTRQSLRQVDFEWFLAAYLTTVGYRADLGSIFTGELGTTKPSDAFLERMIRATGGKVEWRASGLRRDPALAGLFHGPAKGNPRMKARRECWFRLFREECAALPAPTGRDRDHKPEGQAALEQEARRLLAAMRALPAHRAERLQLPCLTWAEYLAAVQDIIRVINGRTWHALEGWEESGYVTHEWRFALQSPWLPKSQYLALPAPQQQLFQGLLEQQPELWRTRRLSPQEVWDEGRTRLTQVSGSAVPILFGPEHARPERVESDLSIIVQDREISPTPLIYDAVLHNGQRLERGRQLAVYLNPFAPDRLEICDQDLRWLGTAARSHRIGARDTEAALRRHGFARKVEAEELREVARLGADITRRDTARRLNNAEVLSGNTPSDRAERARLAEDAVTLADLGDDTPAAEPDGPRAASLNDLL